MKRISIALLILLLITTPLFVFATDANKPADPNQPAEVPEAPVEELPTNVKNNESVEETIAKVLEVSEPRISDNGVIKEKVQDCKVEIIKGEYISEEFQTTYSLSLDLDGKIEAYPLEKGDKVVVSIIEDAEGNIGIQVQDVARSNYIFWMFILFLVTIVVVGGKKGFKAIVGLLLTILIIYFVLVKGVYIGKNAIVCSIVSAMLVIIATFLVIGGFQKKIFTAALGTLGGVISSGIIALIFTRLAKMSGATEDAIMLSTNMLSMNFNFSQLLFSGIIVASLGACMDVGMSIASSLDEIKIKNPEITWPELFKSGMNIGRDVIGTMTNTLILAYVGGSLTLILLFLACDMNLIEILNKETIAEQIMSALAGSMGVIFTVPITSIIYALMNKDKTVYRKTSENRVNGKRSLKL